jgi:hypothetical protein
MYTKYNAGLFTESGACKKNSGVFSEIGHLYEQHSVGKGGRSKVRTSDLARTGLEMCKRPLAYYLGFVLGRIEF